jgi:hypothetical protein
MISMTSADNLRPRSHEEKTQIGGDHYVAMSVQPWDAMEAWMTPAEFHGYLRGNAIKYVARAGRKGDAAEDLRKARHYLDKLISLMAP